MQTLLLAALTVLMLAVAFAVGRRTARPGGDAGAAGAGDAGAAAAPATPQGAGPLGVAAGAAEAAAQQFLVAGLNNATNSAQTVDAAVRAMVPAGAPGLAAFGAALAALEDISTGVAGPAAQLRQRAAGWLAALPAAAAAMQTLAAAQPSLPSDDLFGILTSAQILVGQSASVYDSTVSALAQIA
jgi:hypothetical protein